MRPGRRCSAIAAGLAREHPRTNTGVEAIVMPFHDHLTAGVRPALLLLLGTVGLLLVIACTNVAGLLLARGAERERELSIRSSLGAGRTRLVRQLLAENAILAFLGCALGLVLARWGVDAIVALSPVDVARMRGVRLDGRAVAFAGVVTLVTTLACGIVPALRLSRPQFERSLTEGARSSTAGTRRQRLRQGLVVSEVALAVVLLVGAGLLARSFARLLGVDPGFQPSSVMALQVFVWDRNPTPDKQIAFFRDTLERIAALRGVASVGAVSRMPFIEANIGIRSPLLVEGRPAPSPGEEPTTYLTVASRGYFETLRIPLRSGRLFEDDRRGSTMVAVINETVARRHWRKEDPLGKKIALRWRGRPLTAEVVGVVAPVRHDRLDRPPEDEVFLSFDQLPYGSMTYVVRTTSDPAPLMGAVKDRIWSVDPRQAFYRTATLPELLAKSLAPRRFVLLLLATFAGTALILSAIGLYGLLSFVASQRTREIGVRLALGAGSRDILRMVLGEGMGLILCGIGLGLAAALALARPLRALLFGVSPADPATVAGVSLLLGLVSLLACYLPARRAMHVDPAVSLRTE